MTNQPAQGPVPRQRLLFDLAGLDWDDDQSIRAAAEEIWRIAVARRPPTRESQASPEETS